MNLVIMRVCYVLLLLIGISGLFWIAPEGTHKLATSIVALVLYLPLLLMASSVISGNKRQLTWLCFILLFYFCGYAIQILDPEPVRTLAVVKTSLTVVLFVFAALQLRARIHGHQ